MGLLEGKKALIVGVGNRRSIAWGIATAFQREGAQLAFTYLNERFKDNVEQLAGTLPGSDAMPIVECDASKPADTERLFAEIEARWGALDVLVHSIAYSPTDDLRRRFHQVSREGVLTAVEVSAYTLVSLSRAALPLFEKAGGGAVLALTFNAVERVVPSYNAMAVAKAALETSVRYLAADLGPHNVRVNAISAGPLKTLSASAVKGISAARDVWETRSPLRRNITQEEVGNVAVFLASEWARSVTGSTIFADNGMSIVGVAD
ncbi:MAG: enoyl-ACP reductase [Chloroflexi bacterium]|nr:enoyl-ACP reductase [Chloroflexota bacterium]